MVQQSKQLQQTIIDIQRARQQTTFPVELMSRLLRGGKQAMAQLERMRALIAKEPLFDKSDMPFQSRQEQLYHSVLVGKRFIEIAEEQKLSDDEFAQLMACADMMTPFTLNYGAFIPVIASQGTPAQVKKWLEAAKRHAIIGCYAQTELSHGSNVAALQTTATFDETTDEFIINSNGITGAKWWIGGLGVVATHAVVQAQLVVAGKSYGPHIFIVPIRSPVDHKPVQGVTVGDIGPKAYGGFATTDNGFVLFDNVRIPRENMLMKFAKVSRDGKYTPPVHSKLSYGSMVKLRVGIVSDAGWKLAKAVTIAVRYCTVRRQFFVPAESSDLEAQVISYSSVQHRLFPLIATAYALILAGQSLTTTFNLMTQQLAQENAQLLPEMHIASCALKSWGSRRSSEGLEECRKAMGGHGYSVFSGVSELFATFVPANTYEGDNFVLTQQVARALLKQLANVASGKMVTMSSATYLEKVVKEEQQSSFRLDTPEAILDPATQLTIFGLRAARLVAALAQQLKTDRRSWEDMNMECWDISFAHAEYILLKQLIDRTSEIASSSEYSPLASTLKSITDLFCLSVLTQSSLATFLYTRTIDVADVDMLREQYRQVISTVVAMNTIGLTDAFGFTDRELNTALGNKDGNPYEALWNSAQKNPLNSDESKEKFANLMKTILHRHDNLSYIKRAKL